MIKRILALLPTISVGLDDWHLHVTVGDTLGDSVGITVGPHFLSLDKDGDIAHMLVSPPKGYRGPMSDVTFAWNSRDGLMYLHVPGVTDKEDNKPTYVAECCPEEDECCAPTVRWEQQPEAYTVQ